MTLSLVLNPNVSFQALASSLDQLGWERRPDTSVAPPIIPGEPEFASWSNEDDRISYTFNPVVRLRVLAFYGGGAGSRRSEVRDALPMLELEELEESLRSSEPRDVLLGILAAGVLKVVTILDTLDTLRNHRERAIAQAAAKTYDDLFQYAVAEGAAHLRREKQRDPKRSVLFSRLGDAHFRRQTVRWIISDRRESNEDIDGLLRSALADEDWEVRASAMLAAVRLRASATGADVKRMDLPRTSREGPDEADQSILRALHSLAVDRLAGNPLNTQEMSLERAELRRHVARCMLGQPVDKQDRVFLLVQALTHPLDIEDEPPPKVNYIEERDGTYWLKNSGIEVCWVAPLPHWLGTDDPDLAAQNPVRRIIPAQGFFIARDPISVSQARSILSANVSTAGEATYSGTAAEAAQLCEALGRFEDAAIELPDADEWEIAVRGTDARRYPWGNGFEDGATELLSPWGLRHPVSLAQWTKPYGAGATVCGGDDRCAFRREVLLTDTTGRFAVRPLVRT